MSSLTRRIQIRNLKRLGKKPLPVITETGFAVGRRWPTAKGQLFFLPNATPVTAATKHPVLQPLIDALAGATAPA